MNSFELIIIQPNIIPQQHIQELLNLTNQPTSHASVGSGKEKIELETRNTEWYPIPFPVLQNLTSATMSCYKSFIEPKYHAEIKNIEPVQFLSYPVGGHYIEHNDSENFENGQWTRIANRDISILFYLNDNYTGGELEFTTLGLKIKPKTGMMIAFPSYKEFAHKVHPVTSGMRYSLVTWLETEKKIYETIRRERV
jgi:predicted 2-oxoglutarate/Fe(II)-dependent dioxygenase YbiX